MTNGTELSTFITGLNADAAPDPTLLGVLVATGQTVIESERDWMVLRKTDTSKSASTSGTWQTAIDISSITDFSHFYGDFPVRLFDGGNSIEHYRQVPWDRRLEYKDVANTFVHDVAGKIIYLNGSPAFSGTLYINYIMTSVDVDLTAETAQWTRFPSRFLPILGFYAIGIFKGGVDYDSINRQMLPTNQAALESLKNAMVTWDDKLQGSSLEGNDPTDLYAYPRSGAIDRDA